MDASARPASARGSSRCSCSCRAAPCWRPWCSIRSCITLRHYADLFARTNFPRYFLNSAVGCAGTVVLSLLLSVPAAYAVTRYRFRGREAFATGSLLIYMFPPLFLAIPLFVVLVKLGLANSYLGLVATHTTFALPFSIWLLRTFFRSIALELEEVAWVDGATRLQAFRHVVLPMAFTGILATGIFTARSRPLHP